MNYKNTLNLPQTNFSMKANLSLLEPKIISYWKSIDIYHKLRKERQGCQTFVLHDGPPYANGPIHAGHALNKILKDIIVKYKILRGYDCPFVVGWDCHGLPVEHQLFKELNLTKHDVAVLDFRKKAKDYALKFVDIQREEFRRLGIFSDWQKPYLTLDPQYEYKVIKLLEYLVAQGYIYRGRKPVNWCSSCETALAEAEVEYLDKESDSIYLIFKLTNHQGVFADIKNSSIYFLVWTTTPWTLVSNVAVAVHPVRDYNLVEFDGKLVVLAKDLLPALRSLTNSEPKIIKSFKGAILENLKLTHPFFDRISKVVLADFVSCEEGSGCVHIAPGHGQEDFSLVKKYNLEVIMPLNDRGLFDQPADFKNKDIKAANKLVLGRLKEKQALIKHQKITHSYPHCWRCQQPIIFRATFQWFLDIDHNQGNLRQRLLEETEKVNWVPSSGKERMKGMLKNRPDWCLSRQRLWGVPIPAVKCKSCQEVMLKEVLISQVAEVFKDKGSDSWFELDLKSFLPKNFKCPKCQSSQFQKEFDILDVWFESGASFLAVLKSNPELEFPADLYLEGSDQHRGWFQVSLIPSVAKENKAPFKTILTHGFVVDGEGRKMSKSLGNVIAPQDISRQYGSEILRLWAAYADYTQDVKISEGIIKQLVDIYRKVRNTIRFILGNICDFDPKENKLQFKELLGIDQFMLSKLKFTFEEISTYYEEFSFYKVCQKIFNFCNLDLSSFYLDILKDRLYTFSQDSLGRRSGQFVLYQILDFLLKVIAPIISFTAEEAYQAWGKLENKRDSLFLSDLDEASFKGCLNDQEFRQWQRVISLRPAVLREIEAKREEGLIRSSLEAEVSLSFRREDYEFYRPYQDVLREIFIVSLVSIQEGDFEVKVKKAEGRKCLRCWNLNQSVGKSKEHPDICFRCLETLKEVKL